jgi:hypothetical protein
VPGTPPTVATEFLLMAVFAVVCRWAKRNPSNFLRFILFPFGGISVERWPQFMLVMVRMGAIFSFFCFFGTMLSFLFPTNLQNPAPPVLYTKIAVNLLVTFFVMRGSAEPPVESTRSANKPHPLELRVAGPEPASAAAIPAQPRFSDIEAPPVPNRAYPESPPPPQIVRQRERHALSMIVFGLVCSAVCFIVNLIGLAIFFTALYVLAAALRLYSKNAPVATCPFCGGLVERYNASLLLKRPLRCPNCSEYSQFAFGLLTPVNPDGPSGVAEKPFFRSPAYESPVWPNGCVLCGQPPTRFDDAGAERFQYRRLLSPMAAFAVPHPAAHITGIPYCGLHRDAVQAVAPKEMLALPWKHLPGFAEKMAEDRKAFLLWRSLPMMRRYLAANRQAHSTVSSGYRAPNLFQKIVTAPFKGAKPGSANPSAPAAPNE